ncbi:MAG: hypothetical protein LBI56_04520 [Puniceicoccales bacterium]|jgi:hypothetical protein|nr:hypothetical protein [Puniceicoccales bacterium]
MVAGRGEAAWVSARRCNYNSEVGLHRHSIANRTVAQKHETVDLNGDGGASAAAEKLPKSVDFSDLLGRLGDNNEKTNLKNALKNFVRDFLPKLQETQK